MIHNLFTTGRCRLRSTASLWLAVSLITCTRDKADTKSSTEFKVALLTPGPISDSLDAKVSHIQTRTPAEFDENFRQYGAQGYDLVFGHGFEFQDAALRVAPRFP